MHDRHAEVVGGGFAGLAAATALARVGWSVTLHERGGEIRSHGSALALSENGLKVLEMLGAYDEAVQGAFPLDNRETRDGSGHLISAYDWRTEDSALRMFMMLRSRVVAGLAGAARRSGVEIRLLSEVRDVDPEGAIELSDGTRREAALVVAADGAGCRNRVRRALERKRRFFADGTIRLLLPVRDRFDWPAGTFAEYWSGKRRAMLVPCSEDAFYMGLIARRDDPAGIQVPIDIETWIASFPCLRSFIESIGEQERWSWDQYQSVILRRWHAGRVVLIGDAAHAMSPNFGQGAALAMVNAVSLAMHVNPSGPTRDALSAWEAENRPLINRTQWLSGLYSAFMAWPGWLRSPALTGMGQSRWIMRQRTLAAYHTPSGYSVLADGTGPRT